MAVYRDKLMILKWKDKNDIRLMRNTHAKYCSNLGFEAKTSSLH